MVWANPAFQHVAGCIPRLTNLLVLLQPEQAAEAQRSGQQQALQPGEWVQDTELCLRALAGAVLWVRARATRSETQTLWTLQATSATRAFAAQAQRQPERLDLAQDWH